jgi:16S rRNA (cytidine1402-2'-O)-methyltransferase
MSGVLYIVATPIGNLEDITLRAIKVLTQADIILAEDTRVTMKLLASLSLKVGSQNIRLISYHQHSPDSRKLEILNYLKEGRNIALVTDAGTPGISDPGNELIAYLYEKDPQIRFIPIPGASAIISSLSIAGFDVNRFAFIGFMPKKKKEKLLNWLKEGRVAFAYYDSPHRVIKNLFDIQKIFGNETEIFVARELTKVYETLYRGCIQVVIEELQKGPVKGEIVVVVNK